jgi:pimeloyl-ACP methyl ester carboxylesterase
MSLQRKPSIVFVHGLWADGSCFSKLIPTLQKEGFEVIASQHGLDSHAGDVNCVKRTLGRVSSPAVLVGHSYGGSVITAAGTDPRVAALVYVAASLPPTPPGSIRSSCGSARSSATSSLGAYSLLSLT